MRKLRETLLDSYISIIHFYNEGFGHQMLDYLTKLTSASIQFSQKELQLICEIYRDLLHVASQ